MANLREVLVPFAEAVPWPAIIVDEPGEVLHLNEAMRGRGVELEDMISRRFETMFSDYAHALQGSPPWLTPQEAAVSWRGPRGLVHERLWVRRLPKGACIIAMDESRLHELETSHTQMARLASLGFMLASVSHEISNPLAAIHSMLQILQSKRGVSPATLEKGLASIAGSVRRLTAVTRKLNAFSRVEDERSMPFSVDMAIDEAAALFAYDSLGESIELVHHRDPGAVVMGQVGQLQQVFHNLFLNAAQAMKGQGSITVKVDGSSAHEVIVTVHDSGPGIPADLLGKVFEPFFTTKRTGEGTGLGLAISLEIVQEHKGSIQADNHADGGALFRITLPRYISS